MVNDIRGGSQVPVVEPAARTLRRRLLSDEMIDGLLGEVDAGGLRLTGEGGFLPELLKAVLERGLAVELEEHLGYEKGDRVGRQVAGGAGNSRNGGTAKTVATEVGDIEIATPRDRAGTFTPALVPKGARRLGGLEDMIISLYAGGMTVRDIEHHLARTLGTETSRDTISKITDKVLEEVKAWQNRPLDAAWIPSVVANVSRGMFRCRAMRRTRCRPPSRSGTSSCCARG
jgi:putative transposase